MDRVPYRRVTPPRTGASKVIESPRSEHVNQEESISHGETLIIQCIICAVIFVFVLIITMTNIGPAATMRGGLEQVLTGAETLDELVTDARQLGSQWFGWEPVEDLYVPEEFYSPTWEYPVIETEEPNDPTDLYDTYEYTYTEQQEYPQTNYPPAADYESSNPTVPEPTVTPGLWD